MSTPCSHSYLRAQRVSSNLVDVLVDVLHLPRRLRREAFRHNDRAMNAYLPLVQRRVVTAAVRHPRAPRRAAGSGAIVDQSVRLNIEACDRTAQRREFCGTASRSSCREYSVS